MTTGLPATSDAQGFVGHPLAVMVPVYVPGSVGATGVTVMAPVVSPVMENEVENVEPVTEEIPMKTVPPLIVRTTCCAGGVGPFWIAVKVRFVVDAEIARVPPPLSLPPPPLQAASNSVKAAHNICAPQ